LCQYLLERLLKERSNPISLEERNPKLYALLSDIGQTAWENSKYATAQRTRRTDYGNGMVLEERFKPQPMIKGKLK
jgi:hypothetical protein